MLLFIICYNIISMCLTMQYQQLPAEMKRLIASNLKPVEYLRLASSNHIDRDIFNQMYRILSVEYGNERLIAVGGMRKANIIIPRKSVDLYYDIKSQILPLWQPELNQFKIFNLTADQNVPMRLDIIVMNNSNDNSMMAYQLADNMKIKFISPGYNYDSKGCKAYIQSSEHMRISGNFTLQHLRDYDLNHGNHSRYLISQMYGKMTPLIALTVGVINVVFQVPHDISLQFEH
eukprot:367014_1